MIPLKLELKNFLSYGSKIQTIDFQKHSLFCFSGKNGHGKSALLDAMTWVLWGQARKIAGMIKPDEGLLRIGQTAMMVSLEFNFASNIYRVKREFLKTYGKAQLILDFELYDKEQNKFVSLTDKTSKLTQLKIEKLLGLDYQTFINSAFLRQGQADEFSKKSPKERKQILANILGLSRYDSLQSRALDKVRELGQERQIAQKLQENNLQQTLKENEINKLLSEERNKLVLIEKENLKFKNNLLNKEKEQNLFLKKKEKYNYLKEELKNLQENFSTKLIKFKQLIKDWKKSYYESLKISSFSSIKNKKDELEKEEKTFLLLQQKSLILKESILQKRSFYQKLISDLKSQKEKNVYEVKLKLEKKEFEYKQLANFIIKKEEESKAIIRLKKEYEKKIKELQKDLKQLNKIEKLLDKGKVQFEKRRAYYQFLVQKGKWIKSEIIKLENREKSLQIQNSPACPLCEQVLTIRRKDFLLKKNLDDVKFFKYRLDKITNLITKLKDILISQHDELGDLNKNYDFLKKKNIQYEETQKNYKELNLKINEFKNQIKESNDKKNKLLSELDVQKLLLKECELTIEQVLSEDEKIKKASDEIQKLEIELNDLKYDKNSHEKLRTDILDLEQKLKKLDSFKVELEKQKLRRNKISLLSNSLKDLKKLILQKSKALEELKLDEGLEKVIEFELENIKKQIELKMLNREEILQRIAKLDFEIKQIKDLKLEVEKRKVRLAEINNELEDYQFLSMAFSKNGIQALLIEQAIPQIEEEANNILARLTDNQAQVFIESLRDLKSGGVKETLDIKISDTVGLRPYEMFSGGESFRIDFALRIAISKLLARRAGIALQTLIIDEGFGSQDEDGLNRLMNAIYSIKDDFSKIIVVSHLNTFKDNFPIHFIVEKTSIGSIVNVEERG